MTSYRRLDHLTHSRPASPTPPSDHERTIDWCMVGRSAGLYGTNCVWGLRQSGVYRSAPVNAERSSIAMPKEAVSQCRNRQMPAKSSHWAKPANRGPKNRLGHGYRGCQYVTSINISSNINSCSSRDSCSSCTSLSPILGRHCPFRVCHRGHG